MGSPPPERRMALRLEAKTPQRGVSTALGHLTICSAGNTLASMQVTGDWWTT